MSATDKPLRISLCCPSPTLRVGLRALLSAEPGIEIVAETADLQNLEAVLDNADVVMIAAWDLSSYLLERLWQARPGPKALLLLTNSAQFLPVAPQKTNLAIGSLTIEARPEQILAALRALQAGLCVWMAEPQVAGLMMTTPITTDHNSYTEPLTDRELEVLHYLAQGLPNKQIASKLTISENTVKSHISSIYGKLAVNSRIEAVRIGARLGLVTL